MNAFIVQTFKQEAQELFSVLLMSPSHALEARTAKDSALPKTLNSRMNMIIASTRGVSLFIECTVRWRTWSRKTRALVPLPGSLYLQNSYNTCSRYLQALWAQGKKEAFRLRHYTGGAPRPKKRLEAVVGCLLRLLLLLGLRLCGGGRTLLVLRRSGSLFGCFRALLLCGWRRWLHFGRRGQIRHCDSGSRILSRMCLRGCNFRAGRSGLCRYSDGAAIVDVSDTGSCALICASLDLSTIFSSLTGSATAAGRERRLAFGERIPWQARIVWGLVFRRKSKRILHLHLRLPSRLRRGGHRGCGDGIEGLQGLLWLLRWLLLWSGSWLRHLRRRRPWRMHGWRLQGLRLGIRVRMSDGGVARDWGHCRRRHDSPVAAATAHASALQAYEVVGLVRPPYDGSS
ncbi:hypothetical protein KC333_g127 [Hortaea werneckii]|nr:hypothetical protein KC333_g127 [Hortaea werneckii]